MTRTHRYCVHADCAQGPCSRVVEAGSFEAAAAAYLENFAPAGDEAEVAVFVRDLADGREHCFRIDLESGERGPCA